MANRISIAFLALVLVFFLGVGCSDPTTAPSEQTSFRVSWTLPTDGTNQMDPQSSIQIGFSHPISCASVTAGTITIEPSVAFTTACAESTATVALQPEGLGFGLDYTVRVGTGLRSLEGDSLESAFSFTFRTADAPSGAVFVAPSGSGDGSAEAPFGSLREALDSAAADPSVVEILVAAGRYEELVTITKAIVIRGGLDPSAGWSASGLDSTVIVGEIVEGYGIGLRVAALEDEVRLEGLTIAAPDAVGAGCGSYGLMCVDVTSLVVQQCRVRSGMAQDGGSGGAGIVGDDAYGDFTVVNGGEYPIPGGDGGWGGSGQSADGTSPSTAGQSGHCPDGSAGGAGGDAGGGGGLAGAEGVDGRDGNGGAGFAWAVIAGGWSLPAMAAGDVGEAGEGGCGGGGGGGTSRIFDFNHTTGEYWWYPGCEGNPGGGGGAGGTGGAGGAGGGISIGILLVRSTVTFDSVAIEAGSGGNGGAGGVGGSGGDGFDGLGWSLCFIEGMGGGLEGAGGDGGSGGHGGGGAGGWSIGILRTVSSTVSGQYDITLGVAGAGGSSQGTPGANGYAVPVRDLPG